MKKTLFALCGTLLLLGGCASPENGKQTPPAAARPAITPRIVLAEKGKSAFSIILPAPADPVVDKYLRESAVALQSAIREGTGATLPIVREKISCGRPECCPAVKGIYLGRCTASEKAGVIPPDLKGMEYVIAAKDGNVYIAGHDGSSGIRGKIYTRYYLGTVKGVVRFMEKFIGTRILYPGETGRTTPKQAYIVLPPGLSVREKPLLILGTSRHHELIYDMAHNDFGHPGIHLYGGHSYYSAVPAQVYGKTHPEYFTLRGNKRTSAGNHLCISNPRVQELIYLEAKKRLQEGAYMVELAQTDGFMPCECKKCAELYGVKDFGEKLWILHRNIAEKLYKALPDKKVLIISYGPTAEPPRTFKEFPPNTMIELCRYHKANLAAWSRIKVPCGFTTYIYNWGSYKLPGFTPVQSPDYPAEQVEQFKKAGVKGVYRSGFGASFGLEGPVYYMYGKLWDPPCGRDDPRHTPEALLNDFYTYAFCESALPMTRFYTLLYDRLRPYGRLDFNSTGRSLLPRNPRAWIGFIYTPELLETLESQLRLAEQIAKTPKVRRRLQLVRQEFDYLKNMASIVHFYNAYRLAPDRAGFDKIARAVEQRNRMINSYFDAKGKKKTLPGWPEMFIRGNATRAMLMANGRLAATLGAPFNWDIANLRKRNVLPGALRKSVPVFPWKGGPINDPDQGAWKKVPYTRIDGIQAGPVKLATFFKLMYDSKNLYVAFRADLPKTRTYVPQGRDGGATGRDCLELFLDPAGQRQVYYHLLWNPVPNSFYDAARGLVTDPLDPRFDKADPSWNGKWEVKNFRRGNQWFCVVTIPYSTIRAAVPRPGARWLLNVARTDYFSPKGSPELSLWSPNLENMTFHDPECFGTANFR